MKPTRLLRSGPLVALMTLALASSSAHADDASPALLDASPAQLDAAPASVPVPPGPVIVDTEAGTVTPAPGSPADRIAKEPLTVAQEVIAAARAGNWRYVAAMVLAAIMVLGIRFGGKLFPQTQRGKALLVAVLSLLGGLSTSLATSMPVDFKLALGALGVAWLAVGAREWIATLLWPKDGKQWAEWLKPLLGKTG